MTTPAIPQLSITLQSLAVALLLFPGVGEAWSFHHVASHARGSSIGLRVCTSSSSFSSFDIRSIGRHDRRQGDENIRLEAFRNSNLLFAAPTEYAEDTIVSTSSDKVTASSNTIVDKDDENVLAEEMDKNFLADQRKEYNRGLAVILFVTFLFAANSPLAHAVFSMADNPPPVLLVNAGAAIAALLGLFTLKPLLEGTDMLESPSSDWGEDRDTSNDIRAGFEMGLCKTIGEWVMFDVVKLKTQ